VKGTQLQPQVEDKGACLTSFDQKFCELPKGWILNQSILAKAFRGELVPQGPNDEPASVLLDRIRAEREKAQKSEKIGKGKKNS
jgi:hypothetical protein